MRINRRQQFTIGIFCLLLLNLLWLHSGALAQQGSLDDAIRAVVRIRGCNAGGCNVGLGSGVIIHRSGVILTANHVTRTDKNNPLSPHLEDFIIELTEDARRVPQARYRARLLATKPEADLALLGIYWDEKANQALDETTAVNLPVLALTDVRNVTLGERIHILGYPLAGGSTVNYTDPALGGFDENGALLKVQATLSEGNSGGPALVSRNGHYEIAGLVIRGRGSQREVGLIRSVDQLTELTWEPTVRRVWVEDAQVTLQGKGAEATLQITAKLQALDYVGQHGRLVAYLFDANTQQPLFIENPAGSPGVNPQLALQQDFSGTQLVHQDRPIAIVVALNQLTIVPEQILFRLLLWDADQTKRLWANDQWLPVQLVDSPVTSIATDTATPSLPSLPTETPTHTPAPADTPTHTPTPLPAPTDTPTIEPTPTLPVATDTPTVLPTDTPKPANQGVIQGRPQVNFRAGPGTGFAVVQTLNNQDEVILLGRNSDATWLFAQAPSGAKGWVTADFVQSDTAIDLLPVIEAPPTPTPPPAPSSPGKRTITIGNVNFTFAFISPGTLQMGNPAGTGDDDEHPPHAVAVEGFWISVTEVTNAQYGLFMAAGGYDQSQWWSAAGWQWRERSGVRQPRCWNDATWNGPNYPVVCISWYEGMAYARWLASETGVPMRLPREDQWEWAARGAAGRTYPWGDGWDGNRLNYCDANCDDKYQHKDSGVNDGFRNTAPVGSYGRGATPEGVLDLAGNVWEWTSSSYRGYPFGAGDGREDENAGGERVVRSGGCFDESKIMRSANRRKYGPDYTVNDLGLRLVFSAAQ